jgi:hypothetical protein
MRKQRRKRTDADRIDSLEVRLKMQQDKIVKLEKRIEDQREGMGAFVLFMVKTVFPDRAW